MKKIFLEPTPPRVTSCPDSFDVQLNADEITTPVTWKEATFLSVRPIKQVFKSRVPGYKFGVGTHFVSYIATTDDGQTAKCEFAITVKGIKIQTIKYFQQLEFIH